MYSFYRTVLQCYSQRFLMYVDKTECLLPLKGDFPIVFPFLIQIHACVPKTSNNNESCQQYSLYCYLNLYLKLLLYGSI